MAQKMNKIYYVCFLTCLHLIYKSAATNDNEITKAFKLLKEGDEKIIFSEEHKNVTLVIGNTGAGKTTFLQWIAGDKDELMSQEQGENMGQFIIVDQKDRISISTINSKTIFPELVVDNNANEAYYDCPGFRDSRSLSHDIAGTYFTKNLTDYYEGFKIVLIANYHSVRKGIDRHDFINLMRHTTEFIKNVNRFKNSIAMVVTKVENTYIETEEENHDLVPDEEVIKNIANFLQNVKDHLQEKVEKLDIEEKFYESTIKLLNILLENDNGTYTRLGIFRRPNKKGLLSEVTVLQEGKKHVQQILRERLKYSLKGENDFGFTISEKSKNDINGLVEEILNKLRIDIAGIILDIQKYCSNEITRVNSGLDSFIDDAEVVTTDLHTNLVKIHHITSIIPLLLKQVENLSDAQHLSGIISKAIIDLRIHADIDKITNIAVQGRYYNFFKNIYRSKMKTEQWITYFSPIIPILRDAKEIEKHIRNKVDTIDKKMKHQGIKHLTDKELDEYYRKELDKLDIKDVPAAASNFKTSALDLLSYRKCMELLKILNDGELKTWPAKWMAHFQKTIKYLSESVKWYQFLGDLLDELSTYQVQMNRNKYNVANIDNWGKESNQTGIWINKYNFKRFIEKLGSKYDLVKDLEVTESQLRELNHLLDLTLKDTIKIECGQSDKLVIKGSYVKTSDFTDNDGKIRNKCKVNLNSVYIFASDTLIIDKDLNGVGKQLQLSILSPKWHVVGTKKIDLDGSQPPRPSKASDSSIPSGTGSDGQAGLPGGPAGNFFGLANEITNGESLTITANGGPGGFGQDGGNGGTGRKGEDAKRDDSFERKYITGDKLITLFYNKNTYQYRYRGKPGAVGGPGGNGGVGGYGGWEGRIKMLILLKSLNLPTTRNSGGSDGTGGKGGNGGRGGTRGNDIIAHYCEKFALFIPIQLEWCGEDIIMSTDTANLGANGKKDFTGVKMPPEKPKSFQNIPEILNDYKYYLRENLLDRFKKRPLLQFLQKMDNKEKVKGEYDTIGLVEEFHQLEKQRDTLSGLQRENFIYFYQSILNRTHELAKNLPLPNKRVLSLLYTAVFGILNNLEAGSNPNLIINVEQNFDLLTENVKNLRTLQKKINKVEVIDRYKDMYKSVVNKKIEEAQSIITNRIIPKIEDTGINMENQIESLIKEIIFLQEQNRELKGELMQKKKQLEKLVTLHYVFSSLKIFGHIAKCFGLYGVVVGTATETVSLIGDPFIVNRVHLRSPPKLPDGVTSGIQKLQTAFRLDMTQSSIEKSNLIDKYKNNEKAFKTIDEAIERAKYNIQNLERYEAEIREIAIPILKNLERDIDRIVHQLGKKSKIALEEIKWQVQTVLKDMKLQMRLFTKGFKTEETLARCIENLEETVTTLINVYDMMQNYQQEKELADYLADISSPTTDKEFTDPKLWKAAKELEITIRSNLVLKQYQIAIGALKQQAFPLAYLYLEEPKLPNSLTSEDSFQSLIDKVIAQIATIKTKMKEYESSISHHDKYMNSGWFNGNFKSAQPFFIWEKEKYGDLISNLLSGKKVTLKPDILTSHPDKDAIKFNKIGIHFRSSNSNITSEINDKLRMYMLNATHSGNSYYRFNKNIYIMTSSSQNIMYSFEKDDCGIPVIRNGVYEKIKTKNLMLSPYAMWEMQLVSVGKKNRSISDLEMYKGKVDLELVGHGAYMSIGYNISMADVEKYYKADDDLSAPDFGN